MEQSNTVHHLLEMIDHPAFCVRDGVILHGNKAALQQMIPVGSAVADILPQDISAYESFTDGCLYLTVTVLGIPCGASVTRTADFDIFLLEAEPAKLQALALAGEKLRAPLHDLVIAADLPLKGENGRKKTYAHIKKSLHQLHRMVCNMSDAARFMKDSPNPEPTELGSLFYEISEKLSTLLKESGIRLNYTGPMETIVCMADRVWLERAVSNLVSNAAKFSAAGATIDTRLTHRGKFLHYTITDTGSGIDPQVRSSVFSRYLRPPGLEDNRHGIGLGMAMVRTIAAAHGGTVLIEQPTSGGTRITMTIVIQENEEIVVRSPVQIPAADYAGGYDHGLLELSDVLPSKAYKEN